MRTCCSRLRTSTAERATFRALGHTVQLIRRKRLVADSTGSIWPALTVARQQA